MYVYVWVVYLCLDLAASKVILLVFFSTMTLHHFFLNNSLWNGTDRKLCFQVFFDFCSPPLGKDDSIWRFAHGWLNHWQLIYKVLFFLATIFPKKTHIDIWFIPHILRILPDLPGSFSVQPSNKHTTLKFDLSILWATRLEKKQSYISIMPFSGDRITPHL